MRKYELTLILEKSLKKEDQKKLLKKIQKWLGKGKVLSEKSWGEKIFSYPIKKKKKGIYLFLEIKASPEKGGEIEKRLKLEKDVLRYLLIKKD